MSKQLRNAIIFVVVLVFIAFFVAMFPGTIGLVNLVQYGVSLGFSILIIAAVLKWRKQRQGLVRMRRYPNEESDDEDY